jgi:hypothetical protein
MNNNKKYVYEGAVYARDSLVSERWKAVTWASSESKAISNLKYRFRNDYYYEPCVPLSLPGSLTVIGTKNN